MPGPQELGRVDHAAGCSSSKALRKKTITSSTARRVGWSGASIRSPVKTECGAFPRAFMPAGLAALSGQFRAGERGTQSGAQGLETRGPADSVAFEPIAAQFQAVASARLHAGEISGRDI